MVCLENFSYRSANCLLACIALYILTDCCQHTASAPINATEQEEEELMSSAPFLSKYGYLPDTEPEMIPTMDQLTEAVRLFQISAHLTPTGHMDTNTSQQMTAPRCGVPDVNVARPPGAPENYVLLSSSWTKHHLTWSVDNDTPDMERDRVRAAVTKAFRMWEEVSVLTFQEVHPPTEADIHLTFVSRDHKDGHPFDGPGQTLAHAFPPGEMEGGDVHFDDDETFTEDATKSREKNLVSIAAHEIGHSLGLDHTNIFQAMMFGSYNQFKPILRLHEDDIAAIQSKYGVPFGKTPAAPKPSQAPIVVTSTTRPSVTLRPSTGSPAVSDKPPNPCKTAIDTLSVIRGQIFVFRGEWFWRLNCARVVIAYPVKITDFWTALPSTLTRIDAVVERPDDSIIVFFIGDRFYELQSNSKLATGSPPSGTLISTLFDGPNSPSRIDTAFTWGSDRTLYITTGNSYYHFTSSSPMKVIGGPLNINNKWVVPVPLDAVLTHSNGNSYFFKGSRVYHFNSTSSSRANLISLSNWLPQCAMRLEEDTSSAAESGHTVLHTVQTCLLQALFALLFLNFVPS